MRQVTTVVLLVCAASIASLAAPPRTLYEPVRWGVKDEGMMDEFWFKAPRPVLTIPRVTQAPAVDGSADDACWKTSSLVDLLTATKGFNAQPPLRYGLDAMLMRTEFRLCYDDKAIYIHATCYERLMPKLEMKTEKRDGSVWKDDCLEFFFDTNRDRTSAYHAIINPRGALYDASETGVRRKVKPKDDRTWSFEGEQVVAKLHDDRWEIEAAFPFKSLGGAPKLGDAWGMNLCRQRRAGSIEGIWTYGTWAGTPHCFSGAPDQMGDIVFGDAAVHASILPRSFLGNGEMGFTVIAPKADMKLNAHVEIVTENGETRRSEAVSVLAPSGKKTDVRVPYSVDTTGTQYATLVVQSGGKSLLVARRGFAVTQIQPVLDGVLPRLEKLKAKARNPEFLKTISPYLERVKALAAEVGGTRKRLVGGPMDNRRRADWESLYQRARTEAGSTTYLVWRKDPLLATSSNDFPSSLEDLDTLQLCMAQNEYELAGLMVTNLTEGPLDVIVNEGRGVPALLEVRAPTLTDSKTVTEENPTALGYDTNRGFNLPGETGEPLPKLGSLREMTVPPLGTRQLILVFNTAASKPGRHGGQLEINTLNKALAPKKIRVQLDVWPFALPTVAELGVHYYDYSAGEQEFADLAEHKVNMLLMADNGRFSRDKDGAFVHDMTGPVRQATAKLKYGRKGWAYGICRAFHSWATGKGGMKYMDDEYQAAWRETVRSLVKGYAEVGLAEDAIYVCASDEVKGKDCDTVVALLKILREVAPKLKVSLTVQCTRDNRAKFVGLVNVWVPGGGITWDDEFYNARKVAGDEVWNYLCKTPVRAMPPVSYYRHYPWRAEYSKLDGIAIFAWSYMVYRFNGEVIPTRGYEGLRQGVEDWQYLNLLKKEIARVRPKDAAAADDGQRVYDAVMGSVVPNKHYYRWAEPDLAKAIEDGRLRMGEMITKLKRVR